MFVPLAAAVGSVALGTALAFLPGRHGALLGPIRSFALTASVAVVLTHLLPEAYHVLGNLAFLVFAIGLALPSLAGGIALRVSRWKNAEVGLQVGYVGLLVHHVGDGLSMGALSEHDHGGHAHHDVVIALAAHTVPVAAMVVLAFGGASRKWAAGKRAIGLGVSGAVGVVLGHFVSASLELLVAWVAALTAGLVLHVVAHDLRLNPPRGVLGRSLDLAFAGLGLGVGVIGAAGHGHEEGEGHGAVLAHLLDFTFDAAPVLLVALTFGALLQALVPVAPPALGGGSRLSLAAQGVAQAAVRPLASSGMVALVRQLPAAHPAQLVSLWLAAPVLTLDFALISLRFLGLPLTLTALFGVALLALVLGAAFGERAPVDSAEATLPRGSEEPAEPSGGQPVLELGSSFAVRYRRAFDGMIDHLGAWMLLGLLAAALVEFIVPPGAFSVDHPLLALLLVSLVMFPAYVSPTSAVPMAAVAIAKGLPPGAAIAGLALGACLNLSSLRLFRSRVGTARTLMLGLGLLLGCWCLAWLIGRGVPVSGAHTQALVLPHTPGPIGQAATALFLLLVARSVWNQGVRAWAAELTGAYGHEHHFAGRREQQ